MKKLIEGLQLAPAPPAPCPATGILPAVRLKQGLVLDDGNAWSSPTLIMGSVGSGKSTLLRRFLEPIREYAVSAGDALVVFCAKPELLKYAQPGDIVISGTAAEPAFCWNIFEEMDAGEDPEQILREISLSLFHEAEENTMQPFFPQAAEDIFFQSVLFLYERAKACGHRCDHEELVGFLTKTPIWSDEHSTGWLDYARVYPERFSMMRDYLGDGNAQGLGILSEIRLFVRRTLTGSFARAGGRFSARRAVREGRRIYLHYDYAHSGRSSLIVLKTILDLLLKEAMSPLCGRKVWFFLDEFALLPHSDVLVDALLLGRDPDSTGRGGVRIIAALQSARLMMHHYRQEEGMALLSLFPNIITLRIADPMSRDVLAERYGKAHCHFSYSVAGDKVHHTDAMENVVSDYAFSAITEKGDGIFSLPGVSPAPFIYRGFEKGVLR